MNCYFQRTSTIPNAPITGIGCATNFLNPGQEKTVLVTVRATQPGTIRHRATVTSNTSELYEPDNTLDANVVVSSNQFPADVGILDFSTTNNAPRVGDVFTVKVRAKNFGSTNAAENVSVNVAGLGSYLRYVPDSGGTHLNGVVSFPSVTLAPGATTDEYRFNVQALSEGANALTATVTTSNADTVNTDNNRATIDYNVTLAPLVDVVAYKSAQSLNADTFSIVVENLGPNNVTGVRLILDSPTPMADVPFGASARFHRYGIISDGADCSFSNNNRRVTCNIGNLVAYECAANAVRGANCPYQIKANFRTVNQQAITARVEFNETHLDPRPLNHQGIMDSVNGGEPTPTGGNVTVQTASATVTFGNVSNGGQTFVAPIPYSQAGTLPGSYQIVGLNYAFDVNTNSSWSVPVTVCFYVPEINNLVTFEALRILHNEGGILRDRTVFAPDSPASNFATRTICARANSLSPFIIAAVVDPAKPQIAGRVTDQNGNPLADVKVVAAENSDYSTVTDADGNYALVNLPPGSDFTVQVIAPGYSSNPVQRQFTNLTANQTGADFALTPMPTPSVVEFEQAVYNFSENVGNATLTLTRTGNLGSEATIAYQTGDISAVDTSDYTGTLDAVTFAANETTKTFTIPVLNDAFNEPVETFSVKLIGIQDSSTVGSVGAATLTINDDDALPTISVADVGYAEGNAGETYAVFDVTLSAPSNQSVSALYTTADNTAVAGEDYTAVTAAVTIPAGATVGQILIPLAGDTTIEPNETFSLALSAPVNASLADGQAVGSIVNDDFAPTAATVLIGGRVRATGGKGIMGASVVLTEADGTTRRTRTGIGGKYSFAEVAAGQTVMIQVVVKGLRSSDQTRVLSITEDVADFDFTFDNR